jgi:hypothetical protein
MRVFFGNAWGLRGQVEEQQRHSEFERRREAAEEQRQADLDLVRRLTAEGNCQAAQKNV